MPLNSYICFYSPQCYSGIAWMWAWMLRALVGPFVHVNVLMDDVIYDCSLGYGCRRIPLSDFWLVPDRVLHIVHDDFSWRDGRPWTLRFTCTDAVRSFFMLPVRTMSPYSLYKEMCNVICFQQAQGSSSKAAA